MKLGVISLMPKIIRDQYMDELNIVIDRERIILIKRISIEIISLT